MMALRRTLLLAAAVCGLALGQTTGLTTIQDTLYQADGTKYSGTLTISWSTFDATNLGTVVQQSRSVPVLNGNLLVQLVPNATATPPANIYTVLYQSAGTSQFTETWSVPASTQPLKVTQVRTTGNTQSSGGTGQGNGTGTANGSTSLAESSVVGLQGDLAQRPIKGAGYGTNAVAIIDNNGNIETAVGDLGSCVFVDGTTGQCAPPVYSDAEMPGGTIDGVNAIFTLAGTPLGSSLMLFRNGLHLTANLDYTASGSSLQFFPAAIPQPGDTLMASYRVDTTASSDISGFSSGQPVQLRTAAAQVVCSGPGTSVSTTTSTTLGGCDIPAAGLKAGDRIEVRFNFVHSGTASGFGVQVKWGDTVMVNRAGGLQDAAVAGHADAGITASGAQISAESWGTVLPFLPAVSSAASEPGIQVSFTGAMTQAGADTIALANFTVLRYPAN